MLRSDFLRGAVAAAPRLSADARAIADWAVLTLGVVMLTSALLGTLITASRSADAVEPPSSSTL
ncbi:MAG: hypothetical protein AAF618_12105 [Pseudomonadota bacterium]